MSDADVCLDLSCHFVRLVGATDWTETLNINEVQVVGTHVHFL
jgi:hypothetical protein